MRPYAKIQKYSEIAPKHTYMHTSTHTKQKSQAPLQRLQSPSHQAYSYGRKAGRKTPHKVPELTLVEPQNIWIEAENLRSHKAGHSFTQTLTK